LAGEGPGIQIPRDWSPDGRFVAYDEHPTGGFGLRQARLTDLAGQARRLTTTSFNTNHGRFSPDGRSIAYVSDESGRPEVYLSDLEGRSLARRVTRARAACCRVFAATAASSTTSSPTA
jgi:Tol biopolymer transport system component